MKTIVSNSLLFLVSLSIIIPNGNSLAISIGTVTSTNVRNQEVLARGIPRTLRRVLDDFRPRRFNVGNTELSLSKNGLRHILVRHHPDFWNGSVRSKQTFFRRGTTVSEIENIIEAIILKNRTKIRQRGAGTYPLRGEVNGVNYVLKIDRGQIRSLYPE